MSCSCKIGGGPNGVCLECRRAAHFNERLKKLEMTTVPVADLRELLALRDEAVRVIFNVAQAPCYSEVPQVDRDAVRAFLAKAGGK